MGDQWPNKRDDYELLDVIGHGGSAIVQSALCKPRNEKCAIKRINLEKAETSLEMLQKEIQAMSQCKHENVMNYFTSFVVKEELWVVMRLCTRGSMHDILKKRMEKLNSKNGVLDEATIATVLRDTLRGLEYMHKNGQIHRDIKAGNILLNEDGSVLVADFGVCAWVATGKGCNRDAVRRTFVGTPCWMAPEVMDASNGYDVKADIWSLGITAIELAVGMPPFFDMPPMKVLITILQNDPPNLEVCAKEKNQYKGYSKAFRRFISDCLQKSPAARPSAKQLLKHDFLKKAKDKNFLRKLFLDEELIVHPQKNPAESSGKPHKNDEGEWVFFDDEDDTESSREQSGPDSDEQSSGTKGSPQSSAESVKIQGTSLASNQAASEVDGPLPAEQSSEDQNPAKASEQLSAVTQNDSGAERLSEEMSNLSTAGDAQAADTEKFHLILRLRGEDRKLQDIRFDFTSGQDTFNSLAYALVDEKLLDPTDVIVVAANIERLVLRQVDKNSVVFRLASGCAPNEVLSETNLYGFALISINENYTPRNQ